jgi:hypothetical protein
MDLEMCEPLLSEEKPALVVDGGLALLPLLDVVKVAGDLLHGQVVEVKQGLYQNSDLLERLGDDMLDLLDNIRLDDLATKDGDVVGEPGDAHGEVVDAFSILEADFNKPFHEFFCVGFAHPLDTNSARFDHLPCQLSSALGGKGR